MLQRSCDCMVAKVDKKRSTYAPILTFAEYLLLIGVLHRSCSLTTAGLTWRSKYIDETGRETEREHCMQFKVIYRNWNDPMTNWSTQMCRVIRDQLLSMIRMNKFFSEIYLLKSVKTGYFLMFTLNLPDPFVWITEQQCRDEKKNPHLHRVCVCVQTTASAHWRRFADK